MRCHSGLALPESKCFFAYADCEQRAESARAAWRSKRRDERAHHGALEHDHGGRARRAEQDRSEGVRYGLAVPLFDDR